MVMKVRNGEEESTTLIREKERGHCGAGRHEGYI
jgi:hypothetical protein